MIEQRISSEEYLAWTKSTRDRRMAWFREARFGLFIHYGLFSAGGTGDASVARQIAFVKEYIAQ